MNLLSIVRAASGEGMELFKASEIEGIFFVKKDNDGKIASDNGVITAGGAVDIEESANNSLMQLPCTAIGTGK